MKKWTSVACGGGRAHPLHLHSLRAWYFDIFIFFAVIEATTPASVQENSNVINKVIYISLGVTSAFLLLSVAIFVWCYRKRKAKSIERFVKLC